MSNASWIDIEKVKGALERIALLKGRYADSVRNKICTCWDGTPRVEDNFKRDVLETFQYKVPKHIGYFLDRFFCSQPPIKPKWLHDPSLCAEISELEIQWDAWNGLEMRDSHIVEDMIETIKRLGATDGDVKRVKSLLETKDYAGRPLAAFRTEIKRLEKLRYGDAQ